MLTRVQFAVANLVILTFLVADANSTNIDLNKPTICVIAVRLVDGPSAREGRLEVYYNSSWGTVCDDGFTDAAAAGVCYMLGYG